MFHQYGCLMVMTTLAVGAKAVILPKFNLMDMLRAIQDYKVVILYDSVFFLLITCQICFNRLP